MGQRTEKILYVGTVEHHHEAVARLVHGGDTALVHRGCDRSLVMSCPDGCGSVITINLDNRVGPAWRRYGSLDHISVFPSVWRETGCRAHFIVWRGTVDWLKGSWWKPSEDLVARVRWALPTDGYGDYTLLAQQLAEIPWDVLAACRVLVNRHQAAEGLGNKRGAFRLLS